MADPDPHRSASASGVGQLARDIPPRDNVNISEQGCAQRAGSINHIFGFDISHATGRPDTSVVDGYVIQLSWQSIAWERQRTATHLVARYNDALRARDGTDLQAEYDHLF